MEFCPDRTSALYRMLDIDRTVQVEMLGLMSILFIRFVQRNHDPLLVLG